MKITELAKQLGISRQVLHRHIKRGCPTDSLEAAIAWRDRTLDFTQTKGWRIDGNKGIKYLPSKPERVNENAPEADRVYTVAEIKIIEETLTKIVPGLWFGQIGWLGTALRERGVKVTAEQLIDAQGILFLLYMNEVDELLKTDCVYETPSTLMTRHGDKAYPQLIARLKQVLSEENTPCNPS